MEGRFVARFMSTDEDGICCKIELKITDEGIEYNVETNEKSIDEIKKGRVVDRSKPITDRRCVEFVEIMTNSCFMCENSSISCSRKKRNDRSGSDCKSV